MKSSINLIFLLLSIVLGLWSCQQQTDAISSVFGENLLKNPSFEENGQPSSRFWNFQQTPTIQFTKEAPSKGGTWSVALIATWIPPITFIAQTIETPRNIVDYQLSFWVKHQVKGSRVKILGIYPDTTLEVGSIATTGENQWKQYIYSFQVPSPAPDSLRIELWASVTELSADTTFYDLVELRGTQ